MTLDVKDKVPPILCGICGQNKNGKIIAPINAEDKFLICNACITLINEV